MTKESINEIKMSKNKNCYNLILNESLECDEIVEKLKTNKGRKCYNNESFWMSDVPERCADKLVENDIIVELLFGYLANSNFLNESFSEVVLAKRKDLFIRIFKITRAFENDQIWEHFYQIVKHQNLEELDKIFNELEFIREYKNYWDTKSKSNNYLINLKGFTFYELLIHSIAYYEKIKRSSPNIRDNKQYELTLGYNFLLTLNNVLNNKLKFGNEEILFSNKKEPSKSDLEELREQALPPLNTINGLRQGTYEPEETIDGLKKLIRETFYFFFKYNQVNYQIEEYLRDLVDFIDIDKQNLTAILKTNRNYAVFKRNDIKNLFEDMFFTNKIFSKRKYRIQNFNDLIQLSYEVSMDYFKYLGLPSKIEFNGNNLDLKKVFLLLKTFSFGLMPSGRNVAVVEDKIYVFTQKKPQKFKDIFEENYIVFWKEDELMDKISEYFKWPKNEVKQIVNFLTTDLNDKNQNIDIISKPIIKLNNFYFWLSSFYRDRRWEIIIHRRLAKEGLFNHKKQSDYIEKKIADAFKSAGFKAINSYPYKFNGKDGEIDVLAYRDKMLFIIEVKTILPDENIINNAILEYRKFDYKASEQLSKSMEFVNSNIDKIYSELNISQKVSKEEIKIVPIIVSNIYEGDETIFKSKFFKISLFELMIILRNDLCKFLNIKFGDLEIPITLLLKVINNYRFDVKKNIDVRINCNLWTNKNFCSAHDFISAIEESKIWKVIDSLYDFSIIEPLKLDNFDPEGMWKL